MATPNVYLTFDGECEKAFEFYRSVFGGTFKDLNRFGEMPPSDDMPPMPDEVKDKIMHVSLPMDNGTVLMGSDTMPGHGGPLVKGNNFSISLHPSSRKETEQLFSALSKGGQVTMPLEDTFWGAYFGMCVDPFGIQWMMNYDEPANE